MVIKWPDLDDAYLVCFPELTEPDRPQTHGATYEAAAKVGAEALDSLIESFEATGRPLPEPDLHDDEAPDLDHASTSS